MSTTDLIEVRLAAVTAEALGIKSYDLRPVKEVALPPFSAGAHVDVHLANGLVRSYSLSNSCGENHRYVISVARDLNSRGGSAYMHDSLRVGDTLMVSPARNHFPLRESAEHSILIAGGIGITPLWCMVQRLEQLGRSWELFYCTRTQPQAAFMAPLLALKSKGRKVHFNFDGEPGGRMLDLAVVARQAAPDAHIYCCGPVPMLAAFEQATASWPRERVHVEYFAPKDAPADHGGFTVVLAKSGTEVVITKGQTILDALLARRMNLPYSCLEGTCGECAATVISGTPDHRDVFFTEEEHASNQQMTICCSGSKGPRLVLDI